MFCKKCGANIGDDARFCNVCGASQEGTDSRQTQKSERWESTTVKVSPSKEKEVVEKHERFGWELLSSQTIDTKDSHLEEHWDAIYSVTESTNYVKLTFRRNKNMPHYDELVKLEKMMQELKKARDSNEDLEEDKHEYDEIWTKNPEWDYGKKFWCGVLIAGSLFSLFYSFLCMGSFAETGDASYMVAGLIAFSVSVLILVTQSKKLLKYRKDVAKYEEENAKYEKYYKEREAKAKAEYSKKKSEIYSKAEELLSGK